MAGIPKPKYEPFITHNRGTLRPVCSELDFPEGCDVLQSLESLTSAHINTHYNPLLVWTTSYSYRSFTVISSGPDVNYMVVVGQLVKNNNFGY